jgi:tRNA(His) 5'-end guanylyltransferase
MFKEYKIESIMIPENYVVITTNGENFTKIIKENYTKKSKAIIYSMNRFKYLVDANSNIVIQTES